jgi:hypothetical protein
VWWGGAQLLDPVHDDEGIKVSVNRLTVKEREKRGRLAYARGSAEDVVFCGRTWRWVFGCLVWWIREGKLTLTT